MVKAGGLGSAKLALFHVEVRSELQFVPRWPAPIWISYGYALLIDLALNAAQVTYTLGQQQGHGITIPSAAATPSLQTFTISLDQGEYFTHISGTNLTNARSSGPVPVRVASLTFSTNKKVYGPFGAPSSDKPFEIQGPVYGFHGAVSRGDTTEALTALGFWKVPSSKVVATGSSWTGNN